MEIAVISGRRNRQSSISAAFATLNKTVGADCDVDAANLHILFDPTHEKKRYIFQGSWR